MKSALWARFELPDRSHDLSPLAATFMQPHRMSGHAGHCNQCILFSEEVHKASDPGLNVVDPVDWKLLRLVHR